MKACLYYGTRNKVPITKTAVKKVASFFVSKHFKNVVVCKRYLMSDIVKRQNPEGLPARQGLNTVRLFAPGAHPGD